MNLFRVPRLVIRAVSTAVTAALLLVVAIVGMLRILFAVGGTALGFAIRREIATRRFRRRLARRGLDESEVDEFTRRFRSMVPFLGSFRIRR
jgi:DivIVA domain-containing protein